jgi:hypothetical protein
MYSYETIVNVMDNIPSPYEKESIKQMDSPGHLNEFKNEILKEVREVEKKMEGNYKKFLSDLDVKLQNYDKQLEWFSVKIKDGQASSSDKMKLEKVDELSAFHKKATDQILTHDVRINAIQKDLRDACFKYDKIFLENLTIPGCIGEYCKYKSIKDYLEVNMSQVGTLMTFKEKHTLDLKAYKERVDGQIREMSMQLENVEKHLKLYTAKLMEQTEESYKKEISHVGDRLSELRMENHKYAFNLQKTANELAVEYDKILNIKSEVYKKLDDSVDNFKNLHKGTLDDFHDTRNDFEGIKKKFTELAEFIKDVRFRKNLGVEVSKKDIKKLANNITYEEKKRSMPPTNRNVIVVADNHISKPKVNNLRKSKSGEFSIEEKENSEPLIESYVKMYIEGKEMPAHCKQDELKQSQENEDITILDHPIEEKESISHSPIIHHNKSYSTDNDHLKTKSKDKNLSRNVIHETSEEHDAEKLSPIKRNIRSLMKDIDINIQDDHSPRVLETPSLQVPTLSTNKLTVESKREQSDDIVIRTLRPSTGSSVTSRGEPKKFKDKFPIQKEGLNNSVLNNHNNSVVSLKVPERGNSRSFTTKEPADAKIQPKEENLKNEPSVRDLTEYFVKNIKSLDTNVKDLKNDLVKKLENSEKKLLMMEHHTKKKLEELATQIKNFIPINFNAYYKNENKNNPMPNTYLSEDSPTTSPVYNDYDRIIEKNVCVNMIEPYIVFKNGTLPVPQPKRESKSSISRQQNKSASTLRVNDSKPSDIRSLSKDKRVM